MKHLGPDGQPPSGQTKADIFKKTRRDLFLAEQEESKAKSKNPASFKKKPFSSSWYPVQWGVFLEFGKNEKVMRQITAGRGYISQDDYVMTIGVHAEKTVDITVRWPDGKSQVVNGLASNQRHQIKYAPGL